ncbi:MAG: nucleotidyl transferase AbiEii/AbiGii toxin family protein [Deltaproteobacteria bacterium]|nr:nucleotidyl transferase AbiEii/AbiGii toxin family protein [Deltaproteobacteria bacterium]
MDSSRSRLGPLQRQLLQALRPVSSRFFVSGGAALGGFHLGHRFSVDIDLFVTTTEDLRLVGGEVERACAAAAWRCETRQDAPGFRRYAIEDASGGQTLVDVVLDTAEPVEPDKREVDGIRVDGVPDLVVNKLCALLGRSSVKDLVDLYFLARAGIDPVAWIERAKAKDGGMDPAVLARVAAETDADPSSLVLAEPVTEAELRTFRDEFVNRLLRLTWPEPPPETT